MGVGIGVSVVFGSSGGGLSMGKGLADEAPRDTGLAEEDPIDKGFADEEPVDKEPMDEGLVEE